MFHHQHPKWDRNPWFIPLRETTSIADLFTGESFHPWGAKVGSWQIKLGYFEFLVILNSKPLPLDLPPSHLLSPFLNLFPLRVRHSGFSTVQLIWTGFYHLQAHESKFSSYFIRVNYMHYLDLFLIERADDSLERFYSHWSRGHWQQQHCWTSRKRTERGNEIWPSLACFQLYPCTPEAWPSNQRHSKTTTGEPPGRHGTWSNSNTCFDHTQVSAVCHDASGEDWLLGADWAAWRPSVRHCLL